MGFEQDLSSGDTGNKCADVVITPDSGDIPLYIDLSTAQSAGHIFYVVGISPTLTPQHNGDNAVSPTNRIGTNHGSIFIGAGNNKYVAAVCYQDGLLDSNVTRGGPYISQPGGGI